MGSSLCVSPPVLRACTRPVTRTRKDGDDCTVPWAKKDMGRERPGSEALKSRQREIRAGFPQTPGLRVHRSTSWIGRAAGEAEDPDARFLVYRIASTLPMPTSGTSGDSARRLRVVLRQTPRRGARDGSGS